ncbi:MAG: substrate-binding domain-containing protein [Lachnospiraceae bacterium]|nr:substrate-binding domain-containing protein [Lachnospiraceae bacterium]
MISKEYKTIGLIVENINTDYTQDLIHSVYNAIPRDENIRVFTFAGKGEEGVGIFGDKNEYVSIYNSVVFMAGDIDFDGYIIALGSLRSVDKKKLKRFTGMLKDVPRVYISADIGDGVVIDYDNESGIREVVDLLVNIGNLSRFAMLGGGEDNFDAVERRDIFTKCLSQRGITMPERAHVTSDMSITCYDRAEKLLDDNPDAEVIFCVNDAVAKPLYDVMKQRGITPGRDVKVFGFDNTRLAAGLEPPLSSIGTGSMTVGKKALEVLLNLLSGEKAESAKVATTLYARASMEYDMLSRTLIDVTRIDRGDLDIIFDMCFYRYKNEIYNRENVNLRRLFNEIMFRIIKAMKNRCMSEDEYGDICRLIDILIDNGVMEYTDPQRFVQCINQLQSAINTAQKSVAVNVYINRLFLRIKDRMVYILSGQKEAVVRENALETERMKEYLMSGFNRMETSDDPAEVSIRMLDKLGVDNLLFYMYEKPFIVGADKKPFPQKIDLRCMIKEGEMYVMAHDRRSGAVSEMFKREEIPSRSMGYVGFPVFCKDHIFGILACEPDRNIYGLGELIAAELGRTLFVNEKQLEV